jgi:hypothetical protein
MRVGASLNDTRLAWVVFFVTFALSYPALAGDSVHCTKTGCQNMSVHQGCSPHGSGRMRCRTHQLSMPRPPLVGPNGGAPILQLAPSYAIDRGSTICN